MRTLIIDNYDSFTNNLYQYVALAGSEPDIVRNDAEGWTRECLASYDNVVISPGPGSPERPDDFGICADVIEHAEIPLLGVCLGHQGICYLFGGRVGPAPEVRHGRPSAVEHDGTDLFRGVPSPFTAIRYHSLVAYDLPAELEATAWSDDGVLMGVRHRERPIWGVQFHPESICTEFGQRIIDNFMSLTAERGSHRRPSRRPAPQRTPALDQQDDSPPYRVVTRMVDAQVSAEVVYAELYAESEWAFWLDSSLTGQNGGRFSFMGDAAGPLARVVTHDVWTGRASVRSGTGWRDLPQASFFDWLEDDLRSHQADIPAGLPFDFTLGWVGYLGYEMKAECGGQRAHQSPHPDAAMIFADRAVAFDHHQGTIRLLALCPADDDRQAGLWLDEMESQLNGLAGRTLADPVPLAEVPGSDQLELRHDRASYLDRIAECQREITAGETYEVCLTNMITAPVRLPPWQAYRELRRRNPVPFAALLRFGGLSVMSCSPERFIRVSANGTVDSKPIKGTRPRSPDPEVDRLLREDLARSRKDRAENLMIVDLVRHDLGVVCDVGSVSVDPLFAVESFTTVHQLVSTVRGRLRADASAVSCIRSAFPGGSMTGAPKIRTMEIIDRLEEGPRGVYSGALGYFSLSGAADFSIVIRTLVSSAAGVEYGVGGAIIALSDPEDEFEETAVKAAVLLRLLGATFPERVARDSLVTAGMSAWTAEFDR